METAAVTLSDADVRERLLAHLRTHGQTRAKTLTKRAGTPYERSLRILDAMHAAGDIEQIPDGIWRGSPMHAWMIAGGTRKRATTSRFAFSASETLAAMQSAARMALMQRAA